MAILDDTVRLLSERAVSNDSCLVFYSGGKDSTAVLDLCCRTFRQVVAVHMYFVPGLQVVEERLNLIRARYGVDVYYTPHWMLSDFFRKGLYCFPQPGIKHVSPMAVFAHARSELGIQLIAHGGRAKDSGWRRRMFAKSQDENVIYPIKFWNKIDVLAYLKMKKIPAPEKFDLDLSTKSLLWLADNHPDDFRRVCQVFPHAEAVVYRRKWYGFTA